MRWFSRGRAWAAIVVYTVLRSLRTARDLGDAVDRTRLGNGPARSVLVAEPLPLVAAIGLMRSQVVVSAPTLALLDDDELVAAIAHERAHIRRGHRFVLLLAGVCAALSRWQPGGATSLGELRHQVERDTDRSAVGGENERLALAS